MKGLNEIKLHISYRYESRESDWVTNQVVITTIAKVRKKYQFLPFGKVGLSWSFASVWLQNNQWLERNVSADQKVKSYLIDDFDYVLAQHWSSFFYLLYVWHAHFYACTAASNWQLFSWFYNAHSEKSTLWYLFFAFINGQVYMLALAGTLL